MHWFINCTCICIAYTFVKCVLGCSVCVHVCRLFWRLWMTCSRSRLIWRRSWGRSCIELRRCWSVNAAPSSCWKTSNLRCALILFLPVPYLLHPSNPARFNVSCRWWSSPSPLSFCHPSAAPTWRTGVTNGRLNTHTDTHTNTHLRKKSTHKHTLALKYTSTLYNLREELRPKSWCSTNEAISEWQCLFVVNCSRQHVLMCCPHRDNFLSATTSTS